MIHGMDLSCKEIYERFTALQKFQAYEIHDKGMCMVLQEM